MSSNRISETITSSDITQRLFLLMILGSRCSVQDEKKSPPMEKKKAHRWQKKKKGPPMAPQKKKGPPMAKRKAQRWPNIKFLIK